VRFSHQFFPRFTRGIERPKANLNSGFPGMAGTAKRLQITQRIRKFRPIPDRLDMIDLKPVPGAALHALPAVTLKREHAHSLPAPCARHASRMPFVGFQPHMNRPPFDIGRPFIRAPSATARTVAAAASMRPVDLALASFRLFAGSRSVTASANADRNNNDGFALIFPS
jgi:hypothetical protein